MFCQVKFWLFGICLCFIKLQITLAHLQWMFCYRDLDSHIFRLQECCLADEDIEHYLMTLECITQERQHPRQDWVLHLLPRLSGNVRADYVAMNPDYSLKLCQTGCP